MWVVKEREVPDVLLGQQWPGAPIDGDLAPSLAADDDGSRAKSARLPCHAFGAAAQQVARSGGPPA